MKCPFDRNVFCEKGKVFSQWVREKKWFNPDWLDKCETCCIYPIALKYLKEVKKDEE